MVKFRQKQHNLNEISHTFISQILNSTSERDYVLCDVFTDVKVTAGD